MKIGLVCPYNIYNGGGVQEGLRALQSGLVKRGHVAKIITPLPRITQAPIKEQNGVIFVGRSAAMKAAFKTNGQVSVVLNTRILDEILDKEQFELLNFHEPWVPIVSRQILARSSAVNVATFHAKLPDTATVRTIEKVITPYTKSIMKYLDGLTAVSDAAAEHVKALTKKPVTIIPNGIDIEKYQSCKNKTKTKLQKTILYVGRLEGRKGIKYLIKAYAQFAESNPNTELIIAGDGPDRAKLEYLVESLKISGVKFLGYVSEKKKLDLLCQADLFCAPAIFGESFGIVLLESMAAGVPTIAGANSGYVSVMKETGKISIVSPRDTSEFARRMEIMLYDQEIRKLWQSWSKEYVKQFSYDNIIDKYENYYESIIAKKR
jgi:phosphatidyl-myo-inositol alpha-mannosyltransferase